MRSTSPDFDIRIALWQLTGTSSRFDGQAHSYAWIPWVPWSTIDRLIKNHTTLHSSMPQRQVQCTTNSLGQPTLLHKGKEKQKFSGTDHGAAGIVAINEEARGPIRISPWRDWLVLCTSSLGWCPEPGRSSAGTGRR